MVCSVIGCCVIVVVFCCCFDLLMFLFCLLCLFLLLLLLFGGLLLFMDWVGCQVWQQVLCVEGEQVCKQLDFYVGLLQILIECFCSLLVVLVLDLDLCVVLVGLIDGELQQCFNFKLESINLVVCFFILELFDCIGLVVVVSNWNLLISYVGYNYGFCFYFCQIIV